ncbi:MAG: dynamin family protein [Desulfobacterales bacterium]
MTKTESPPGDMPMYRENYINALRKELLEMVEKELTPVALRYGYSEVPLESNIKWRPQVLVLGNYSSGKSTLINEFLGGAIQRTGQAPTDDSFTVITFDETVPCDGPVRVTEERDGRFLLNDPEFPFEALKKHGQRFATHFRLKKVNSPFLKNLALIDTPGMLDSITERDRGYNYQDVIGDLAQIADLVLVMFDPHKAGTVREAHVSLRDTLPARTFDDRVLYVLNRVDECTSLSDLLRVYGTLCWNLSQITGRKDIPMIHLTYSPHAANSSDEPGTCYSAYLKELGNQREQLKKAIAEAPRHRLDHLATFIETHGERLAHLLEALMAYRRKFIAFQIKNALLGLGICLMGGAGLAALLSTYGVLAGDLNFTMAVGAGIGAFFFVLWMTLLRKFFVFRFHRRTMQTLDQLTPLENQTRRDSWQAVRDLIDAFLKKTGGGYSLATVRQEHSAVRKVFDRGAREVRAALNELSRI